ncbi:MAG: hypothetical protein JEZ06_08125 [Anaerolineaceae bacterium]|nr:hypothetical protein [Anaerolineaceae bacterium]
MTTIKRIRGKKIKKAGNKAIRSIKKWYMTNKEWTKEKTSELVTKYLGDDMKDFFKNLASQRKIKITIMFDNPNHFHLQVVKKLGISKKEKKR